MILTLRVSCHTMCQLLTVLNNLFYFHLRKPPYIYIYSISSDYQAAYVFSICLQDLIRIFISVLVNVFMLIR